MGVSFFLRSAGGPWEAGMTASGPRGLLLAYGLVEMDVVGASDHG